MTFRANLKLLGKTWRVARLPAQMTPMAPFFCLVAHAAQAAALNCQLVMRRNRKLLRESGSHHHITKSMYLMLRKPSQKDRVIAYEYVGMRYRQEVDAKGNPTIHI